MARSPHYKGNNEGGYGNPPVSGQFKGKPGPGRPKGSKSIHTALRKTLRKKVTRVGKDGTRTLIDATEALADQALHLGLTGSLRANIEALKLADKYGPEDEKAEPDLRRLTDVELEMYGYIAYRALGLEPAEEPSPRLKRILLAIGKIVEQEK